MKRIGFLLPVLCAIVACTQRPAKLPYLGEPVMNGKETIYPTIANFSFTDQDSQQVTPATFADKIYVADFIFLSCPTICPKLTKSMQEVYLAFAANNRVALLSHTIDPASDSVARLKQYAQHLGVATGKWHFVTGNEDSILHIANNSYFSAAYPDSLAPGGFTHSGGLLLIDRNRFIRGVYDGTNHTDVQRLISDIQLLLKEQF